jgi:mannose-6-phosphate isomerase-like protein (cupin superfamily)
VCLLFARDFLRHQFLKNFTTFLRKISLVLGILADPSFMNPSSGPLLIRHEGHTPRERSICGWRDRLISREDADETPAAWAHAVDIDGAKLHYHKRSTELYYVLEGTGEILLDGVVQPVAKGSLLHIPPGVVHGARGHMRVLVVGIPDIAEDDYFEVESPKA